MIPRRDQVGEAVERILPCPRRFGVYHFEWGEFRSFFSVKIRADPWLPTFVPLTLEIMASRIVFPFLAGCAGIAVAMIAAYPLMVIEQVIGIRYVWWLIGFLAFISTAFATAEYSSACSPSFKNGPYFHILYFLIAVSVPLLVVYVGLFSEIIAVKLTGYDGPLGGFFEEPEALSSHDRLLFCRSSFYIGALLPLIVIVTIPLIRRCKRGMGLRTETRIR